ncbi:MAG: conjugal transfer protein [Burkholderiales bacterium]|nr:conjugal transfer protein [Burkholderiales bacterium]
MFCLPVLPNLVQRMSRAMRAVALGSVGAALLLCGPASRADEDSQRESLARIAYELSRLEQLAAEGSKQQEANTRTRFRFDWLARDLALIRRGIEDHGDAPRQPRPVPALRGDYRP